MQLLNVWRPATFGTLRIHPSRLRQRALAANCGVGFATFFSEPRAERREGKSSNCRIVNPELHGLARTFSAKSMSVGRTESKPYVPSHNLANTSDYQPKTAKVGTSYEDRNRACHIFPQAPRPAGGKASGEAAGLDRIVQAELQHLPKNISREEHFDWPKPHGTSACVASRSLGTSLCLICDVNEFSAPRIGGASRELLGLRSGSAADRDMQKWPGVPRRCQKITKFSPALEP
jgi:hypothetical protein